MDAKQIRNKLSKAMGEQRALMDELEGLVTDGASPARIARLEERLNRLAGRRHRLVTQLELARIGEEQGWSKATTKAARPFREQVLDVLDDLGIPSAPKTIEEFAAATRNLTLPTARFSSLRRDERRGYDADPHRRPAWVVPAININGLTPIPRLVASSAWPAEQRLVGGRTLRVAHLRTILSLLRHRSIAVERGDQRAADRLTAMLIRAAISVPGATEVGAELDVDRVEGAVRDELKRVEPLDLEERQKAAERLATLPHWAQLWGRPEVIQGDAEAVGGR